jgi:hypothetical protein
VIDQPVDQAPVASRAVGQRERCEVSAALVDERSDMGVLVNVDPDDQGGLLARG